MILLGWSHASLIETLRPDIAYPSRRVRQARSVVTEIFSSPCDCSDRHIMVYVGEGEDDPAL